MRDRGRLEPVRRVELAQDVRDVDAGRLDADHERRGDLAVGVAAGDERSAPPPRAASGRGSPPGPASRPAAPRRGGARSSRARSASSSSSRSRGLAPIRAATACASRSGTLASARERAGGDERLGLAPAAVGRERRALEPLPGRRRLGPRLGSRARRGRARTRPRPSASQPSAFGVIADGLRGGAPRGGRAASARGRAGRGARRRRGGRVRAPPAPPARAVPWRRAGRGSARPRAGARAPRPSSRRPRPRPSSGAPRGRGRRGSRRRGRARGPRAGSRARPRGALARRRSSPRPISTSARMMSSQYGKLEVMPRSAAALSAVGLVPVADREQRLDLVRDEQRAVDPVPAHRLEPRLPQSRRLSGPSEHRQHVGEIDVRSVQADAIADLLGELQGLAKMRRPPPRRGRGRRGRRRAR